MFIKLFGAGVRYSPGQCVGGLRIVRIIGEGRYGICYLVTDDKSLYILKQLKGKMYKDNLSKAQYEGEILKTLKHGAIPGFIDKIENRQLTGYVLEYKQGVPLEAVIFGQGRVFERQDIYSLGKQLIGILQYLHGKGIVHRDIRIPNILLDGSRIYLVDFGLARWMDGGKYKADIDFSYFGDFLIYLYYTSFSGKPGKSRPWYEELVLSDRELAFLKKLMGLEKRYQNIKAIEADFDEVFADLRK